MIQQVVPSQALSLTIQHVKIPRINCPEDFFGKQSIWCCQLHTFLRHNGAESPPPLAKKVNFSIIPFMFRVMSNSFSIHKDHIFNVSQDASSNRAGQLVMCIRRCHEGIRLKHVDPSEHHLEPFPVGESRSGVLPSVPLKAPTNEPPPR